MQRTFGTQWIVRSILNGLYLILDGIYLSRRFPRCRGDVVIIDTVIELHPVLIANEIVRIEPEDRQLVTPQRIRPQVQGVVQEIGRNIQALQDRPQYRP